MRTPTTMLPFWFQNAENTITIYIENGNIVAIIRTYYRGFLNYSIIYVHIQVHSSK